MLSQTVSKCSPPTALDGGTNPEQFGLGVAIGATTTNMSQGSLESTNVSSDLAIQGNGFFAVSNGVGAFLVRGTAVSRSTPTGFSFRTAPSSGCSAGRPIRRA